MNYPASSEPPRSNTPAARSNPDLRRCANVTGGKVCRSFTDVRIVLLFGATGDEPSQTWLCAVCEGDLERDGVVVARVLSRAYNPTAEQLEDMRRTMSEQAELWPTGF